VRDLVTVNGVRVTVEDGTWGLVRASSNKPELVVVVESPASEARMHDMFKALDAVLRTHPRSANTTRRSDAARCRTEARSGPRCRATDFGAEAHQDGNHRGAGERASRGSALVFEALARNRGLPDLGPLDLPMAGSGEVACGRPPKLCMAAFPTFRRANRERVQVRSFRKHLDQGGNLGRDGTLAPDENRRSDIEFRWQV
jgi:hypothetical protein